MKSIISDSHIYIKTALFMVYKNPLQQQSLTDLFEHELPKSLVFFDVLNAPKYLLFKLCA